jgi:hypothetical protein
MSDRPLILAGLTLFVAIVTTPIWHGALDRNAALTALPLQLLAQEKQCVAPASYMRTSHMQLLDHWRDEAVRDGQRQFIAFNGKTYDKNPTRTCLTECHTDRKEFCERCHDYAGVSGPDCWDCHNDSQRALKGRMRSAP